MFPTLSSFNWNFEKKMFGMLRTLSWGRINPIRLTIKFLECLNYLRALSKMEFKKLKKVFGMLRALSWIWTKPI